MRGAEEEHQSEDVVPQTGLPEPSLGYPVLFCVKLTDESSPTSLVYEHIHRGKVLCWRDKKKEEDILSYRNLERERGQIAGKGQEEREKSKDTREKGTGSEPNRRKKVGHFFCVHKRLCKTVQPISTASGCR